MKKIYLISLGLILAAILSLPTAKTHTVIHIKHKESPIQYKDLGQFKITHYCKNVGTITALGHKVKEGVTVAVDKNVIPLHSFIYVEDYGALYANDTGGAIKGSKIDIYIDDCSKAKSMGVKSKNVYLLK